MSVIGDLAAAARRLGPVGEVPARAVELYGAGLRAGEGLALRTLRARLEAVDAGDRPPVRKAPGAGAEQTPATVMADLLERSLEQNTADGQRDAYLAVLRQLVPDEARIIAALAEGPPVPLVHVLSRAGGERILENASLIGRTAALTLPSHTPIYVTHLRQLGLVETGPEDPDDKQGYEMLMADKAVRAALKEGELSKIPARTVKRTLVLTDYGRALWEATRG